MPKQAILFLDEATGALDKKMEKQVIALIMKDLPNVTIILISHNPNEFFEDFRRVSIVNGLIK